MKQAVVVQGRQLQPEQIKAIADLIENNPQWSRRRLSLVLASEWNWRNGAGHLKDMATRSLLVKLEARGLIQLPARRQKASSRMAAGRMEPVLWNQTPIHASLKQLGPLCIQEVSSSQSARKLLAAAFEQFHYLGYRGSVGENLQYTVTDERGRLLAGLLFGAAAWKCQVRDEWIGWNSRQRSLHLNELAGNARFLVLPWVRVPHLASWILGQVLRRLSRDWQAKYGHPLRLVETFVDGERFAGTCYRAANWICLGATTGRSRQDRHHRLRVGCKKVFVYALGRDFRRWLCR